MWSSEVTLDPISSGLSAVCVPVPRACKLLTEGVVCPLWPSLKILESKTIVPERHALPELGDRVAVLVKLVPAEIKGC